MATLKLNKKNAGPTASDKRGPKAERRPPIRGKGVSRPRQSLEQATAEREQRQAQFEQRRGDQRRSASPETTAEVRHKAGRDGWRNQGPRFESRAEQGFRGRELPRAEGRHESRLEGRADARHQPRHEARHEARPVGPYEGRFDSRVEGRPHFRDQREQRDQRDQGAPRKPREQQQPRGPVDVRSSGGFWPRPAAAAQEPRAEANRAGFGREGQAQRGDLQWGHQAGGGRRQGDERWGGAGPGGPGRREDRWQGQRPSYAAEPQRDAERGGPGRAEKVSRHAMRPDGRADAHPGRGTDAMPRQDPGRGAAPRPNQPRPSAAAERAAQALPAHLREAAAQLRRQLGDDEDDEDGDVSPSRHEEGLRLSKQMGVLGLASRREADEWIAAGWVRVNGKLAVLGQRVQPDAKIEIDPQAHKEQAKRVTILLHKPIGYVSGQAEDGYEPASVLIKSEAQWKDDSSGFKYHIGHSRGLAPAGRLDIDSTGLLVLTQDGRIAKLLIGEDSSIEKEYLVRVEYHGRDGVRSEDGRLPAADLALLNHGLELDGVKLKPAKVSWQNEDQLRFVLREGRKRQIRRMCEQVGLKVVGLKRVRIGRINLGNLPVGQWRFLTPWERFD